MEVVKYLHETVGAKCTIDASKQGCDGSCKVPS